MVQRRLWRILVPVLLCGVISQRAHGQSGAASVRLQVGGDACPGAAVLRQKLQPLLGDGAELTVEPDSIVAAPGPGHAVVVDLGDRYAIEVGGLRRELPDPARDCIERARVAAVFIALNVKAQPVAERPPPEPEPREPETPEAEPSLEERGMRWGVRLSGEASYALAIDRSALGAGAGVWLGAGAFHFDAGAGALSPAEVELEARDGASGSVALMRIPLTFSASYLLRVGAVAFGPVLGLGVDLLRLRGQDVTRPQTELRINPGALAAVDAHLRFTPELSVLLRVGVSAFPRAYDLSVDPQGRLGSTPRAWLSGSLGVQWQVR